jgi:hypothetical protein
VQVQEWRRNAPAHGALLNRRSWTPAAPLGRQGARLLATLRDEHWGKEANRVDHQFGEDRPILTGQAPSLQLVGSGEATPLGITGCE